MASLTFSLGGLIGESNLPCFDATSIPSPLPASLLPQTSRLRASNASFHWRSGKNSQHHPRHISFFLHSTSSSSAASRHSQGILDPICPAPSWSMAASPFAWTVVLISYPVPRSWPCCRQLLSTAARMITDVCISLVAPPPQAPRRLLFSLTVKCWTKGHKSLHNLAHLLIL